MGSSLYTKKTKWKYHRDREISVLILTLIVESYYQEYPKIGISKVGVLIHDSHACGKGNSASWFTLNSQMDEAASYLIGKIKREPNFIKHMYQEAIKKEKITKKRLSQLNKAKGATPSECYHEIREIFLSYFGYQVFPLLLEGILVDHDQKLLEKLRKILIEWRGKTHKVNTEMEQFLNKFMKKTCDTTGLNLNYLSDQELIKFLEDGRSVKNKIADRKKGYVVIWKENARPPYEILANRKAKFIRDYFNRKRGEGTAHGGLKGTVVSSGELTGKAYVAKNKKDLSRIPPGSVIVIRVVEVDDFYKIKASKVGGVVTEEGGMTSHIAILGRELGVPVLMGVKKLMSYVKNKQKVHLDAKRGVVEIIEGFNKDE